MRRQKHGFTLIEVMLFLAVTGLLFLSVTIGVQNSIYQQRYNDVVQSFANFLRNVYDEVLNVQSVSDGRQNVAIYGKLITFGEGNDAEKQAFYVYDVIGQTVNSGDLGSGTTLGLLKMLGINVVFREAEDQPYKPVGIVEEYMPNWGARIQPVNSYSDFKGSLLIARDPKSGTVRTFFDENVINVKALAEGEKPTRILLDALDEDAFKANTTVDFCVNPRGNTEDNNRRNIRVVGGSNNSSGVEIIGLDDKSENGNKCNK